MRRLLVVGLVLSVGTISARAADPSQMFQTILGVMQQAAEQQQLQEQQRQAAVQQLIASCSNYEEAACLEIIDTTGMPPIANFVAFLHMGDIEGRRGQHEEGRKSYHHALKWARKSGRSAAIQTVNERLAAIDREGVPQATPPTVSVATPTDPVCDAAGPVDWKIACLQTTKDPKGAQLHEQLSQILQPRNITMRQVLNCDALVQKDEQGGSRCFQALGLTTDQISAAQIAALEFELMVETRIKAGP